MSGSWSMPAFLQDAGLYWSRADLRVKAGIPDEVVAAPALETVRFTDTGAEVALSMERKKLFSAAGIPTEGKMYDVVAASGGGGILGNLGDDS